MIGFRNWARLLLIAANPADDTIRKKMIKDYGSAKDVAKLLLGSELDDKDDKRLWENLYKPAMEKAAQVGLDVRLQLFYGPGIHVKACPYDCMSAEQLQSIAGIIFDFLSPDTVQSAQLNTESLSKTQLMLTYWSTMTSPSIVGGHKLQFDDIVKHLERDDDPIKWPMP